MVTDYKYNSFPYPHTQRTLDLLLFIMVWDGRHVFLSLSLRIVYWRGTSPFWISDISTIDEHKTLTDSTRRRRIDSGERNDSEDMNDNEGINESRWRMTACKKAIVKITYLME